MSQQRVAILGYNREGKAALKYYQDKGAICTVFYYQNPGASKSSPIKQLPDSVDLREVSRDSDFAGLLDDFDLVVRTADILPQRIKTTTPITSNTIEFFNVCPAPIIGVTGTKGKGTTSSLITEFLKAAGKSAHLIGNIGTAPLEELPNVKAKDWVVLELSSFQLVDLQKSPHIAVHLMLEPDHLDVHGGIGEYIQAKANIFAHQNQKDIAVYFLGSDEVKKSVEASVAKTKIGYARDSTDPTAARVESGKVCVGDRVVAPVKDFKLRGLHMLDNVCAAVAATSHLISDNQVLTDVLKNFSGLPHRLQTVDVIDGIEYVDDSISSNPVTALAAIKAFPNHKVLILGGQDRGSEYAELVEDLEPNRVRYVILLGETSEQISDHLKHLGTDNFESAKNLAEAVKLAADHAQSGDIVLLSPGAKSFDMFGNYEDRGDQFIEAVKKLK